MKKQTRKHLKDEKRILKLMYKKGFFEALHIELNKLGWEYLLRGKRIRKRKGRNKYSHYVYLPQLHVFSCDYFGEWDSHSIVDVFREHLWWINASYFDDNGYPKDSKYFNNSQLIKYLNDLPTVIANSKLNLFLRRGMEE